MEVYVIDKYINDGIEIVQEIPLMEYCKISEKKTNGLMYELEKFLSDYIGEEVNLKRDLPEIRSKILDASGMIRRLPEGIIIKIK